MKTSAYPCKVPSPGVLVLDRASPRHQWVLWSARGSKGNRHIDGRWDDWPEAIRASIEIARRRQQGAMLMVYPLPGKDAPCRILKFPPHRESG